MNLVTQIDSTVLPLKDFSIEPSAIRLVKPVDERYADFQDFNIEALKIKN